MLENWRKRSSPALLIVFFALVMFGVAAEAGEDNGAAEATEAPDPWAVIKTLEGVWEGAIDGKLGVGKGARRYELMMADQYLVCRHRSIRLPQEKSPTGDQHDELHVFSYDRVRETIVLREFMGEGVVVRSACKTEGNKVMCASEAVENGPGIRSRMSLEFSDRYRFTEVYELAWPGKDFERYFTIQWTRSPMPLGWD